MIIHVNNPIQRASWGGEKLKISVQESSLSAGFFLLHKCFGHNHLLVFFLRGGKSHFYLCLMVPPLKSDLSSDLSKFNSWKCLKLSSATLYHYRLWIEPYLRFEHFVKDERNSINFVPIIIPRKEHLVNFDCS